MSHPPSTPQHPPTQQPHQSETEQDHDPFTTLLNLESHYHAEGYATGALDGARAGQIEGRTFGLEQAFAKFVPLGRLGGRTAVWDARLRVGPPPSSSSIPQTGEGKADAVPASKWDLDLDLGVRGGSERSRRNVERLRELTDPESLSTVNDEESVNAFEERLREAQAKARLVGRVVGEGGDRPLSVGAGEGGGGGAGSKGKGELEDFSGAALRGLRAKKGEGGG